MYIAYLYVVFFSLLILSPIMYHLFLFFDLSFLKVLPPVIPILLLVALFTLLERKILAAIQRRRGPNVVGVFGYLQPIADAFKLILKETVIPGLSNLVLFILAPVGIFTFSLLNWSVLPLNYGVVLADINLGLIFLFSVSSLGVYSIIISGWASNSKYAFLGALRSAAQFISYEVSIGIITMVVLLNVNSLNLTEIVLFQRECWLIFPLFFSFVLFFMAALAETNRIPWDLPEAESELVSGYNVEYAATTFVLFFLAEYSNILIMSILMVIFFFGGWIVFPIFLSGWIVMVLKVCFVIYLFILIRATLPRYRYDQLMSVGWKVLLPLALAFLFFYSVLIYLLT
jgi:NADH-quinone oxidoreductase subunit H